MKRNYIPIKLLLFILTFLVLGCANGQNMKIAPGTFFTINNVNVITLNSNIQNDGSISGLNGTMVFAGSSDNTISGIGNSSFHNLYLNKAGGKLLLQKNISASGTVIFGNGMLDLGNQQFELKFPDGKLLDEKESSRIISSGTGEIFITKNL